MTSPGPLPMPTLRVVDPRRARRQRLIVIGLVLLAVIAAYLVGRYVMIPDAGGLSAQLARARVELDSLRVRLAESEQRLAVVERSEQIARLANENVQSALAQKDGEIANLRRDLALYDRLVGPDAERRGLSVYEASLRRNDDGSVDFSTILTQTQDVRRSSTGTLTVSVEGTRNGNIERLDWPQLAPSGTEDGVAYDFRYFQRVQGRFMLPADFQPRTVDFRLSGGGGVTRTWRWDEIDIQGKD